MKSSSHVSSLSKYLEVIGEFSSGNNLTLFRGAAQYKKASASGDSQAQ